MQKLPRLLHFLLNMVFLNLGLLFLFRLAFWGYFSNPNDPVPVDMLLNSFYMGIKFDLRLVLLILLPLFAFGGFRIFSPFESKIARNLWFGYLGLAFAVVLLFYYMNFGYYAYLQTPMNATVLRFAYNFSTSMQMVRESYPVIPITMSLLVLISLYVWFLHRLLSHAALYANPHFRGWYKTGMVSTTILLILLGLYGKFSYYPLRWSDAFSSPHAFAPAVTLNPVLYFFNTLKNKTVGYDENKTREYYDVVADFLGVENKDPQTLNYRREIKQAGPYAAQRPNVVMVFLESFASYKAGVFGNPLNPTPHFDAMAKQSLQFTRYYSPHTGTARSVFAAITGIPDIELNKTSSRNPLVVDQHTVVNAFKDYEKFYFLGGSANWGNIRGVLQHNIHDLQVYEEGSYSSPRIDVWGISDLDLFREADTVLKEQDKPFFAIIQTSGNHRPYTIPENNEGFESIEHDKDTINKAGFNSNGEYNAFRFMDHSIGFFLEAAKQSSYFDNTIFIFYGDHGITGYGGEHSPEFENDYVLTGFHTPLVFYAPKLITKPYIDTSPASELDLLPTIAGLAAPGYVNTSLGRDLRDPQFADKRYAFTITHHSVPEIGVIADDYYFRMNANGTQKLLSHTRSENYQENRIEQQPDIATKLETLTTGLHETAKYMLYHNSHSE
ncbi:MAG: LTA synthase family protein [Gammaproteobacteria bacterium]|nr:LTA synthase family protein [Gammaproteobacteria bacterium]